MGVGVGKFNTEEGFVCKILQNTDVIVYWKELRECNMNCVISMFANLRTRIFILKPLAFKADFLLIKTRFQV